MSVAAVAKTMLQRRRPRKVVDKPITGRHDADVNMIAKLRRFETLRVNVLPYATPEGREKMLKRVPDDERWKSRSFNFRAFGYTPFGSNWLLNGYLEGNDSLRRNLEGLVANGAIVAALLVTVTLTSLLDGDGTRYFAMENPDGRDEAYSRYGIAYVYLMTISSISFLFCVFASADFYYHLLGFPANDFEIMLMFLTQKMSYTAGVTNCSQFSAVGIATLIAAVICKLGSMSCLGFYARAFLVLPLVVFFALFFVRMNRITAAAWTVEMVQEAQIEMCYEDEPDEDGNHFLRLKEPWASLVGKVPLFPVVRLQEGDNFDKRRTKPNPHDVCLPKQVTAMVDSSIIQDFFDAKPATLDTEMSTEFGGFNGENKVVTDWLTIFEMALPKNPSNKKYVDLVHANDGVTVEDLSHLEFDSLREVLTEMGFEKPQHRIKIINVILGNHA